MAFIGKLHSLEDRSAVRCSKDVAINLDIEHAGADKALLRRLVAGSAVRDDGHAVCVSKRTASSSFVFNVASLLPGASNAQPA